MSVFKVTADFKTIINPDAAKLVPELKTLSQNELIFCILVADDDDGPFRLKPLAERYSMAKKMHPDVDGESPEFKLALEGYKGLMFDRRKHTIEILHNRYHAIDLEIETDLTMTSTKLAERLKMQDLLMKRIDALRKDIDTDEMAFEIKGNKTLSFLEKWQLNQEKYKEFTDGVG